MATIPRNTGTGSSSNNNKNGRSRGAVQVTVSKEQHVAALQKKATDLEQRLAAAAKDKQQQQQTGTNNNNNSSNSNNNNIINQCRMMLCEALSDWLLTDPASAHTADAVGRLWRSCFYARIGPARARLQKDTKKLQQQQQLLLQQQQHDTNNATAAAAAALKAAIAKQEESLQLFLAEGVTLYDYLCDKLQCQLLVSQQASATTTTTTGGGGPSATNNNNNNQDDNNNETQDSERPWLSLSAQSSATTTAAGIVPCLHRLYIHLGDLYRYNSSSSSSSSKAERAYWTAAHLGPCSGHAYNQLAVVCQVKDSSGSSGTASSASDATHRSAAAVTVYWYARSLGAAREPFTTAASNLHRLFVGNREWLQLQQQKQHAAGTVVLAGTASRLFLAQFVDLQYTLFAFTSTSPTTTTTTTDPTASTTAAAATLISDQFYNHLGEAATAFQELLKSSAFGDSLLCKLVTVMAFSQFHCGQKQQQQQQQSSAAGVVAARTATLEFGQCLAERVASILESKKSKPPGQQPPSVPSVRVLMPLLLLTEYLLLHNNNSNDDDIDTTTIERVAKDRYTTAVRSFWKSVIGVFNLLQPLLDFPSDDDDYGDGSKQLKEYQELRGFAPFEAFLKDGSITDAGYLSDAATAELLEVDNGGNNSTQESSTRSNSQVTNLSSSEDAAHAKLRRFVGLRPKLLALSSSSLFGSCMIRIRANPLNNSLELVIDADVRMQDYDDDDGGDEIAHMSDSNDREAVVMDDDIDIDDKHDDFDIDDKHDDVLVYKQNEAGGPALLVPGALLQSRASEPAVNLTGVATGSELPVNTAATLLQQEQSIGNEQMPYVQPSSYSFNGLMNQQDPVGVPLVGFAVLPPPGFGQQQQQHHQESVSMLQGGHLPSLSAPPSVALAPGYFQNLGFADTAMTTRIPTIGESYHLFGGPSALQTANPFATDSMPSFGIGSFAVPPRDGDFLPNQDAMGLNGTTLLDSGLLSTLLMDDSPRKAPTKNPFAT